MLKNYFRIVIQNIIRNKTFTLINILGLSIGIACAILITMWVNHEVSFDRYHQNIDRIGQIFSKDEEDNSEYWTLPYPMASTLVKEIPEVEKATLFLNWNYKEYFVHNGNSYKLSLKHAANEFFQIFSFEFIEGNPENAFPKRNAVIITEETAQKIFGDERALGKVIEYKKKNLEIAGVVKNNPRNSQFQFDIVTTIDFLGDTGWDTGERTWNSTSYCIYLLLRDKNISIPAFNNKINDAVKEKSKQNYNLSFHPFSELHLKDPSGPHLIDRIRIFIMGGVLLIIIAGINYINLSVARYSQRLKEIGVRKLVGASKNQIIRQHIGESIFYSLVSTYLGLILADLLIPIFNYLVGCSLAFPWTNLAFWVEVLIMATIIGVFSGIYPTLILSSFQPVNAIKNIIHRGHYGSYFRNTLVVFQFACAIFFIVGAIVTARQNSYISSKNLGFDRSNTFYISIDDTIIQREYDVIRNRLLQHSCIVDVARSSDDPLQYGSWHNNSAVSRVDNYFFKFFNLQVVSGEPFVEGRVFSKNEIIVNETLANMIERRLPEADWIKEENLKVVGVVKNFHIEPLRSPIRPLVIQCEPEETNRLLVKYIPTGDVEAQNALKDVLSGVGITGSYDTYLLDEVFREQYLKENKLSTTYFIFSLITIVISCMGLLGLAMYSVERRRKEIGIRRVNGANAINIIHLLSFEFGRWVLVAFAFAILPAYYIMDKWLQNFAYRTELSWWIFLFAGFIAFTIATLTVGWLTWRTANQNPVEALRYE